MTFWIQRPAIGIYGGRANPERLSTHVLLDTDILIDIQRGVPQAIEWFRLLPEIPAIPGMVAMEIIQSAQNPVQE